MMHELRMDDEKCVERMIFTKMALCIVEIERKSSKCQLIQKRETICKYVKGSEVCTK